MNGRRWKVLIVDDEVLIRQGIKHYLDWEKEGFHIVGEASNGEEALQLIKEKSPNIVITDIVMPVMDGIQLTEKIKEYYPEIAVIILSSFGDFEYVRATFQQGVADYILKPKLGAKELLKALHLAVESLARINITPQIQLAETNQASQTIYSVEEVIETVKNIEKFSGSFYCIVEVRTTESPQMINEKLENELDIKHYFQVQFKKKRLTYLFLLTGDKLNGYLQYMEKIEPKESKNTWLFSKPFKEINDIQSQYENHIEPIQSHPFYFPERKVFTKMDFEKTSGKDSFNLNHFSDLFKRRAFHEAFDYLEAYTEKITSQYIKSEAEFKSEIENMIFNITILLENLGFENDFHEKKYHFFDLIHEAKYAEDVLAHFNDFLQQVKEEIGQQQENPERENLKRIIEYIDENYHHPITLTNLAAQFHFNPSYLSAYFSTHRGIGLNEYLTQVRIEKAKELLKNSRISISEISDLVGYDNHSYFCKVFKKVTGLSPSKYRKQVI